MRSRKKALVVLILAIGGFLIASHAFARGSAEEKPGEPPYGLATQGDAAGTKLYGVVEVEYSNPQGILATNYCAEVRAVLRVRKGNSIAAFYVPPTDAHNSAVALEPSLSCGNNMLKTQNVVAIQMALLDAFAPKVLGALFGGSSNLDLYLKTISESADVFYPTNAAAYTNIFHVLDVEIAVH